MDLPPQTRIDYYDLLDVHAMLSDAAQPGDVATSDFYGTTRELSTAAPVPEFNTLPLAMTGSILTYWWIRRGRARGGH
jgi:hypothetical protein